MKTRILSILLCAIMLIGIIPLSACQSKAQPVKSKVDHVYKATGIDLGEDVRPRSLITAGQNVVAFANEVISRDPYKSQNVIITIDPATGEFTKEALKEEEGKNLYVQNIAADTDGGLLLLMQGYDQTTQTQSYRIDRLKDGSTETVCEDIGSLFESTGENSLSGGRYFYIDYFTVDGDGNVILSCDYAILVFDKDFNKLFEIEVDGYIRGLGATSDGRTYASYRDNSSGGSQISYIDTAKKGFGENVPLPDSNNIRNADFYVGSGYDIYYKDAASLYGFNAADGEPTELMNFVNSDINPETVQDMAVIDADNMVCYCYDYTSDTVSQELLLLKRVPDEEIPEKYVIKLAYRSNGSGSLEGMVVRFNRASDEYRVELIDYAKYATDDDYSGEKKLESEILAGNAPDIVVVNQFGSSPNWISQGAFCDLNKLSAKDDSFDRSKYFEGVLNAYTDAEGRMYQFVTSFELSTILANGKYFDFDHWDAKKFIEFASNIPEGTFLTEYYGRQMILYMALACSMDSFIDYKNATCTFDSEEFKKLLELAKNTPEDVSYYGSLTDEERADFDEDRTRPYIEGKILLNSNDGYMYSLRSYAEASVKFGEDIETIFLGYPTNNGSGALINAGMSFAITDKSLLKDGAWEFIKSVSSTSPGMRRGFWGFFTNKELFDIVCEDEIGEWNYFTSNGSWGFGKDTTYEEVMANLEDDWAQNGKQNGVLVQTTEEHKNALIALIEGAQALPDLEGKVFEIINEEAEMYYSDAKSLDETVKIIQDRVSTYISEIS